VSDQENRNRWKRDGWEATVRIGVLTPHADVGPESELQAMAPPGLAIHATRVPFGAMAAGGVMDPTIPLAPVRAFAELPHLDNVPSYSQPRRSMRSSTASRVRLT